MAKAEYYINFVKDEEVKKFKKENPKKAAKVKSHLDSIFVKFKIRGYVTE